MKEKRLATSDQQKKVKEGKASLARMLQTIAPFTPRSRGTLRVDTAEWEVANGYELAPGPGPLAKSPEDR